MVTETLEKKELELTTIYESLLWEEDDPRHGLGSYSIETDDRGFYEGEYSIDMKTDSYIWCFTGSRGAGKTTLMTLYALKAVLFYDVRIVSNFQIECYIQKITGEKKHVKSEPLDLERLLNFDSEYKHCLILLDEAPDIISHLASMTWKNRLINIFIREIRKNRNSIFCGAQQFELIDKSFRWQVDIIAECTDASRKYGWGSHHRGKCVLLNLLDNSGQWTGETWEQSLARKRNSFVNNQYNTLMNKFAEVDDIEDIGERYEYFPRALWGDRGQTIPVYDSWVAQDVWESLKRVDMNLSTHKVGDTEEFIDLSRACGAFAAAHAKGKITTSALYKSVPDPKLNKKEKYKLGLIQTECGVETSANGKFKDFKNCDLTKLIKMLKGIE